MCARCVLCGPRQLSLARAQWTRGFEVPADLFTASRLFARWLALVMHFTSFHFGSLYLHFTFTRIPILSSSLACK